jgi:beta-glucosidase
MKTIYLIIFITFLLSACNFRPTYKNKNASIDARVEDLLKRLTFDEKILLIGGDSTSFATSGIERLGVPPLKMSDGPLGVKQKKSTAFPAGVVMASTWDTALIFRVGEAIGKECRATGINVLLGPCINIHRFPYGGRNFESYSEDPYLVSRIAVAYVKGLQSQKIIPNVKHFACNNQEWHRREVDVKINERALREIYLPGFKACILEAGAMGVMSAYNMVNGYHCSENKHLLTDILKNEWNFQGIVISDWVSVYNTYGPYNNGLDIEMPQLLYYKKDSIEKYIKEGKILPNNIDDKVRRALRVRFWAGMFDNEIKSDTSVLQSNEHKNLAREVAEKGIILLKNEGILPIKKEKIKKIAVIGPAAEYMPHNGGGSAYVEPVYTVSTYEAIKNIAGNNIEVVTAKGDPFPKQKISIIEDKYLFSPDNIDINGLQAEYYNNPDFKGDPVLVRTDYTINFNWQGGSPDATIPNDNFSVVWKGRIKPSKSGMYELQLRSDDGSRLYVNGKLIIDNWGIHGSETKTATVKFEKDKSYDIKIEYFEYSGGANIQLGWEYINDNKFDYIAEAVNTAKNADVVILCVGDNHLIETEGTDRIFEFNMPYNQDKLIKEVAKINKNIIVVLHTGVPVFINKWYNDAKALIQAGFPGQEGGNALARIIFGEVNPSGKLTYSFLDNYNQTPALKGYKNPDFIAPYDEGIYVGYRYLEKNNLHPLFPFGFGLSYTTFGYSNLKVEKVGKYDFTISCDIENNGQLKGDEIVQLYIHSESKEIDRPEKELKGFCRVSLDPGQKKNVVMKLNFDSFAYFDEKANKWEVKQGNYEIRIGSSSNNILLTSIINIE